MKNILPMAAFFLKRNFKFKTNYKNKWEITHGYFITYSTTYSAVISFLLSTFSFASSVSRFSPRFLKFKTWPSSSLPDITTLDSLWENDDPMNNNEIISTIPAKFMLPTKITMTYQNHFCTPNWSWFG